MATVDDLSTEQLEQLVAVDLVGLINALVSIANAYVPTDDSKVLAKRAAIANIVNVETLIDAGWGSAIADADAILNPPEE
jgi:hypothetical protein